MYTFTVQRIAVAGIVFLVTLLLARMLEPGTFGIVAFFLYLVKWLLIAHCGAISGYTICSYSDTTGNLPCSFPLFYQMQLSMAGLAVVLFGILFGDVYLFVGVAFIILSPYFSVEPVLRIERAFYISLLPDIVLYVSVLLAVLRAMGSDSQSTAQTVMRSTLGIMLVAGSVPLLLLVRSWRRVLGSTIFPVRRENLIKYRALVRMGLPQFVGSLGFAVLLFLDRYFLEGYHPSAALGTYMLAVQLAAGAALLVSSRNFVAAIDLGEILRDGRDLRRMIRAQILQSSGIALGCYTLLIASGFVLEFHVLPAYDGLTVAVVGWSLGLMAFHVAGSVTPIAVYLKRQAPLTLTLWLCVGLVVLQNLLVLRGNLSWLLLPIGSGFWLAAYAVFALIFTWKITPVHRPHDDRSGQLPALTAQD